MSTPIIYPSRLIKKSLKTPLTQEEHKLYIFDGETEEDFIPNKDYNSFEGIIKFRKYVSDGYSIVKEEEYRQILDMYNSNFKRYYLPKILVSIIDLKFKCDYLGIKNNLHSSVESDDSSNQILYITVDEYIQSHNFCGTQIKSPSSSTIIISTQSYRIDILKDIEVAYKFVENYSKFNDELIETRKRLEEEYNITINQVK